MTLINISHLSWWTHPVS